MPSATSSALRKATTHGTGASPPSCRLRELCAQFWPHQSHHHLGVYDPDTGERARPKTAEPRPMRMTRTAGLSRPSRTTISNRKSQTRPGLSERVLHPPVTPIIESAADALAVTLHETGYVDLNRIAELLARSRDEAIAELGDRIFLDPQLTIENIESWQTADAYLSGPVRTKLAAAIAAAALDLRYQRNVEALRQVQPRI